MRPCSRCWACHTRPRHAAVGRNLHNIVGDMRSACAGRGIPRNCNLPGARNSRRNRRRTGYGCWRRGCRICRRRADTDGALCNHLDHVGRAVGEARDGERGRCRHWMREVGPRRAAVARILHQIVGDRRATEVVRGEPRNGNLSRSAGHRRNRWGSWWSGKRQCSERCKIGIHLRGHGHAVDVLIRHRASQIGSAGRLADGIQARHAICEVNLSLGNIRDPLEAQTLRTGCVGPGLKRV